MKEAIIISGIFISGLIGAGFSTGSEILFYFSNYGIFGLIGIIIVCLLFSFIQYIVLYSSKNLNTASVSDYFKCIMPDFFKKASSFITHFFMLIVFSAMLSGFGELLNSLFDTPKIFGTLIMLSFCHLILKKGYNGFIKIQSFLFYFILFSILLFSFYILFYREINVDAFNPTNNWLSSSVSYVCYNMSGAIAILCIISKNYNKKSILISSFTTFFITLVIMCLLWYIISIYSGIIPLGPMPLLTIAIRQSKLLGYFYTASIFVAMLTTAVSDSFSLIHYLTKYINKKTAHYLVLSSSFLLSGFDFSYIISTLYKFVGFFSIFMMFFIVKYYILSLKNTNY